jgi:transcriptional regulator with XRE-family HTH domain
MLSISVHICVYVVLLIIFEQSFNLMSVGKNIKKVREQKGMTQQQIADLIHMHRSNYSKVESGQREPSIDALNKIAKHFGMSLDELVNLKGKVPVEEKLEDKTTIEQVKLINELEPEDKAMVFRLIDTIVTKKKFKDFFQQNISATK